VDVDDEGVGAGTVGDSEEGVDLVTLAVVVVDGGVGVPSGAGSPGGVRSGPSSPAVVTLTGSVTASPTS
jgi:hypothetical protein